MWTIRLMFQHMEINYRLLKPFWQDPQISSLQLKSEDSSFNYTIHCHICRAAREQWIYLWGMLEYYHPTGFQNKRMRQKNKQYCERNSYWRLNTSRFAQSAELIAVRLQKNYNHLPCVWGVRTAETNVKRFKHQNCNHLTKSNSQNQVVFIWQCQVSAFFNHVFKLKHGSRS